MNDFPGFGHYGQDRRRRLSAAESRFLYERANGLCQRCGAPLDARWHDAHLVSYVHGGATSIDQMEAWCWRCNLKLGARDAENARIFTPRIWQEAAFPVLLEDISHDGVATLHAAPGAGKTFEAAWIFMQLYDAGIVRRLVVVVPNTNLIEQWVEALGSLGIHLDPTPRKGHIELEGTVGCVVCYQSLPRTARNHAIRMDQIPTLVVWDEVHHLAEKAAWGNAARTMVGDVESGVRHAVAVLNITGTLFRSSKRQRIATVRYLTVATDDGEKIQARASYSVARGQLVGSELRHPDLYVYSGQARLFDLKTEEIVTGEIADLDKQQQQVVLRDSFTSQDWLRGFCEEAIVLLRRQLHAIEDEEPLKLLYIAVNIKAAEKAANMLNEVTDTDFARLITSEEPGSLRKLKAAKRERRSCAIVAVQMITEGFDCAHVATTAYASNRIAPLFVDQVAGRNMRVTDTERARGRLLPAQTLIPDHSALRKAFGAIMASAVHEIVEDICPRCGLPRDVCRCPPPPPPPPTLPRYTLMDLNDPWLRSAVVVGHDDGETDGKELQDQWVRVCEELGIGATYAPRVAVASRRVRHPVRVYGHPDPSGEPGQAESPANGRTRTQANPRDLNLHYRAQMRKAAGWMSQHIGHDERFDTIGVFQNAANKAGDIKYDGNGKGMRDSATPEQLKGAAEWMRAAVASHCDGHHCPVPAWLREEGS